jgi:hypothetical protein
MVNLIMILGIIKKSIADILNNTKQKKLAVLSLEKGCERAEEPNNSSRENLPAFKQPKNGIKTGRGSTASTTGKGCSQIW